jgi:hypothetical protein
MYWHPGLERALAWAGRWRLVDRPRNRSHSLDLFDHVADRKCPDRHPRRLKLYRKRYRLGQLFSTLTRYFSQKGEIAPIG